MAQPQHTRNEGHGTDNAAIIEKYADARAGTPIRGQPATSFRIDGLTLARSDGTLRPLDYELRDNAGNLVAYPIPRFNSYTDYWSTSRGNTPPQREDSLTIGKGLADYSSRGFLTVGSSLTATTFSEFPMPPRASTDASYTLSMPVSLCDAPPQSNLKMRYLSRNVVDSVAPSTSEQIKLQARSVWTDPANSLPPQFAINHCVLDDNLRVLIPRAVAYSAGLIDYFFRGRLDIALPSDGVYAVLDHAVANRGKVSSGGAIYDGFTKIKAKVKNVTEPIQSPGSPTSLPQEMSNGTLVAVVKYHLNDCYQADLSGEKLQTGLSLNTISYPPGCNISGTASPLFRTPTEEIVTSQPGVDAVGAPVTSLSTQDYKEITFSFSPPIPINATDVYVQIIYRGVLGQEADAVAVETRNVSEPSYFTFANTTDYLFCVNGTLYRNNPDGSISDATKAAILAAGGTQQTLIAPANQKRAHARILLSAQPPFVEPFTSYSPVTVNPNVKVLADKVFLDYGQNLRLAYLTDRAADLSITNVNQFQVAVADTNTADYSLSWVPLIDSFIHTVHQQDSLDNLVSAFTQLRDFRGGGGEFTAKSFGTTCDRSLASLLTINNSNPTASTLVPFSAINF